MVKTRRSLKEKRKVSPGKNMIKYESYFSLERLLILKAGKMTTFKSYRVFKNTCKLIIETMESVVHKFECGEIGVTEQDSNDRKKSKVLSCLQLKYKCFFFFTIIILGLIHLMYTILNKTDLSPKIFELLQNRTNIFKP